MKKTVSNIRKNTKNLARNTFAGGFLSSTVSSTDLLENLTTSITRPTSNILKTIENTSQAIGDTFKNTAKGNILHTTGNLVTLAPRALGSIAEGTIKTAGHGLQYVSGVYQTSANQLTTAAQDIQQTFSTSDESPDIPHKELHLKDPTSLGRDGSHGLLNSKEPPKSKLGRRLGNIKNSIVNIPMNIGRIGTDIISTVAKRSRGVVESIEGIPKDIKKSRSGVFTKGQSFGTKFGKVFNDGIRGSVKSLGKGARNIINEGVLKTTVATAGIGANFVGRTLGNTVIPLFSTKSGRDQTDNLFEQQSWFQKIKGYYDSTPRDNTAVTSETPKEEKQTEEEQKEMTDNENTKEQEDKKDEILKDEKKEVGIKNTEKEVPEKDKEAYVHILASLAVAHGAIKELKAAFTNKDKEKIKEYSKLLQETHKQRSNIDDTDDTIKIPDGHKKMIKDIEDIVKDIEHEKYNLPDEQSIAKENKPKDTTEKNKTIDKEQSQKESNKAMAEYINQEQHKFTKLYNEQKEIKKEDTEKWIKSLQGYHKAGGEIVFTGKQDNDGKVINGTLDSLTIEDNKVKVGFTSDDNKSHIDEIALDKVFDSKFSIHAPETKVITMKPEDKEEELAA